MLKESRGRLAATAFRAFGTDVRHVPMTAGTFAAATDPDRTPAALRAIIARGADAGELRERNGAARTGIAMLADTTRARFAPGGLTGVQLRSGDRLEAPDRGRVYRIEGAPAPLDDGGAWVDLTTLGFIVFDGDAVVTDDDGNAVVTSAVGAGVAP